MYFGYFLTVPILFVFWISVILMIKNNLITKTSIEVNIIDQKNIINKNFTETKKKIKYHVPKFMLELYEKNKSARKSETEADLVRSLIPTQAEKIEKLSEDHLLIFEIPNSAKDEHFIGAELKILTEIINANNNSEKGVKKFLKLTTYDEFSKSYSYHSELEILHFNDTWLTFNLTKEVAKIFNSEKGILKIIITMSSLYQKSDNDLKLSLMPLNNKFVHDHNYPILLLSYAIIEEEKIIKRHKRNIIEEDYEDIWKKLKKIKKNNNYCRRRPLHINFSEINYDLWIVQPTSYDAYQCQGRCFYPVAEHLSPTKHAIMQALIHSVNPLKASRSCCVPTLLDSISILYVDEKGVLTYRFAYKDMVVLECGCR